MVATEASVGVVVVAAGLRQNTVPAPVARADVVVFPMELCSDVPQALSDGGSLVYADAPRGSTTRTPTKTECLRMDTRLRFFRMSAILQMSWHPFPKGKELL